MEITIASILIIIPLFLIAFALRDIIKKLDKMDNTSQNKLLEKIHFECKKNSDLVEKYNKHYHVN